MTDTALTLDQDGYDNAGTWTPSFLTLWTTGVGKVGGTQHLTAPLSRLLVDGSLKVTIFSNTNSGPDTFEIWAHRGVLPAFSDSFLPGSGFARDRISTGSVTWVATETQTFTIPLNSATTGARTAAAASLGQTKLVLSYHWAGADTVLSVTSITVGTEGSDFTGLSGPWRARGRADECPKCGGSSTRDTWVRDGYTDLMVCPRCYDIEDLTGRAKIGTERPPIGEG